MQAQTATDTPLVQQVQLGKLRNNYSGFVGLHFTTGTTPLLVSALGRYVVAGNTGTHRLKLVTAATGQDVAGSLVTLSTSGSTPGQFQYAPLPAPLTLAANTAYYLASEETAGGDQWYDDDTQVSLSPPATTGSTAAGTGLQASYYNTQDLSGSPALTRTDATVDFTWPDSPASGVNSDAFSVRWTGQVLAPATGTYTFTTTSDDGVRLWVNGQQLIDDWHNHPALDNSTTITLTAGQKYDVKVEFYDASGGARISLQWAYPGQTRQVVPQAQLFPAASPAATSGTGLATSYYNTQDLSGSPVLTRTDATVDFSWGAGSPATQVNVDHFSARWAGQVLAPVSGQYTFSTLSDDGIRLWVNGQQLINNWTDHGPTTDTGTISLTAGQKYSIQLEYYENAGGAEAHLQWAYPGQGTQAIPQSQLFPTAATASRNSTAQSGPVGSSAPEWNVYPNPACTLLSAALTLPQAGPVTLSLSDELGRVVRQRSTPAGAGLQTFELDVRGVPAGFYVLRLKYSSTIKALKVVIRE